MEHKRNNSMADWMRGCMAVAAVFCMSGLKALPVTDSISMRWMGDTRLQVEMPVSVGDTKLKSDYCLVLTPVLKGEGGDSVVLQPVMFAGKRYQKYARRKARLSGTEWTGLTAPDQEIDYKAEVDVLPWMKKGKVELVLHRECEGCCKVKTLSPVALADTRYVPPFTPVQTPVQSRSVASRMAQKEPILHPVDQYKPFDRTIPLRKLKHALYVHFPVEKWDLQEGFRENEQTLQRIVDIMQRIQADTTSKVTKIVIIGLASPEGPVKLNERLAQKRAEVLRDYVDQRVRMPQEVYELVNAGEAWADLRDVVAESNREDREEALRIIDEVENPDERERLIRKLNGGKLFAYLKQDVFADQRNSGYIYVYYEETPDPEVEVINRAIGYLHDGRAEEALQLLRTVENDTRAYTALGSAYYLTGDTPKAMEYYRKAAAQGDADAEKNMVEIENRNRK